ncbi:hypothetical protein TeGR_g15118 [Tetraparma gracilis]|uniref:Uncharacterized protein n=1 Tax=Tetraparma gracilis TaxID=2962635 RepID=A0ABQ6MBG5_9STRA|nr:hypothetical protein TeGR_g15118 [Tetraparma gracilis]
MLAAWVYQAKDSSARKRVAKQTTYGGTVARYHFKNIKTGKKISLATLKADKFYDRAPIDACDNNWVHIAEHQDF